MGDQGEKQIKTTKDQGEEKNKLRPLKAESKKTF